MKVSNRSNYEVFRKSLQVLFVGYIFIVSLGHKYNWKIGESLHGFCPLGAVETFHSWITTGKFIHHTGAGNAFIALGLLLTLIFVGAFFCGWICPFGTVQELIGKLGRKIFKKRYNNIIPNKIDFTLRYFKYFFLIYILIQTARAFKLVFESVDPYYILFNIWSDEIALTGYIVLILFLGLSLIVERPYCRYVCPLGAINGVFNRKSLFTIRRDKNTCTSCGACDRVCPMGIKVSEEPEIKDTRCIRCMKCVVSCPVNVKSDTLKVEGLGRKIMDKKTISIIAILLFLLPIIGGVATNAFEEDKSDRKYDTVDDIRGSYTIPDIVDSYNITEEELVYAFNIENNKEEKLNNLLENQGYSLEDLREVIQNLDDPANILIEKAPEDITLRGLIASENPGEVLKALKGVEEKEVIELKRKSMLVDVKNIVKDYDDFRKTFNIPEETPLNTSLRELIDKHKLDMKDIKTYVDENKK